MPENNRKITRGRLTEKSQKSQNTGKGKGFPAARVFVVTMMDHVERRGFHLRMSDLSAADLNSSAICALDEPA
jgi:hypothetical protein